MKVYTGNFGNVKKYVAAGYKPISIARFNRYFGGTKMPELAPPAEMIHQPEPVYTQNFKKEVLGKLIPEKVYQKLEQLSEGKDVVLLCYEKVGDFCHRHLVADWLKLVLGIEILELGKMEFKTELFE